MPHSRTIEFWREVRELVELGLSLKKASKQFGLSYSDLSQRAAIEGRNGADGNSKKWPVSERNGGADALEHAKACPRSFSGLF
jgi:hypothetical protein